jgi:Protein of unknown function (DUF1360)
MELFPFLIVALAGHRITRFLVSDMLFEPVRAKIWSKFPPNTKFGYLFTCFWCLGFWVSLILVICYFLFPYWVSVVSLVLSISSIIGIIASRTE